MQRPDRQGAAEQELKRTYETGGTVIDRGVELHGDVRYRVRDALPQRG